MSKTHHIPFPEENIMARINVPTAPRTYMGVKMNSSTVMLRVSNAKRNANHPFAVDIFADHETLRKWVGQDSTVGRKSEARGTLSARGIVIARAPIQRPQEVTAKVGDELVTDQGIFRIMDDAALSDPYLVLVSEVQTGPMFLIYRDENGGLHSEPWDAVGDHGNWAEEAMADHAQVVGWSPVAL